MRVLLSFVGSHDPTTSSLPDGNTIDGPILTLVKHCPCDRVVLLSTRDMHDRGDTLLAMLQERLPALDAVNLTCPLPDPTDHLAILRLLRKTLKEESRGGDCFAGVASGTPAMHACWLLIAASGEFPLKLLQLRPERFVTAEHPLITIIDPMHSEFPRVLARFDRFKAKQAEAPDLARMQEQAGIVGSHPALRRELEKAVIYARSKDSVLILGESGTGKELVAKFIHLCSGIRGEFIALNCGGLSENLVDSELFGYKKGAFTGAEKDREGLFVRAKGGTLFLDEIGDMPLPLQVKLLRALQEKKIRPVGADKEVPVDVRVLAATNVNVKEAIEDKRFREDLYYRIAGGQLTLPPLRQRSSDIPELVAAFLERSNLAHKKRFTGNALRKLQQHPWRGNIRELELVVTNALRFADGNVIDAPDIEFRDVSGDPDPFAGLPEPHAGFDLDAYCGEVRRRLKARALEITGGNKKRAAELLAIAPAALSKKEKRGDINQG